MVPSSRGSPSSRRARFIAGVLVVSVALIGLTAAPAAAESNCKTGYDSLGTDPPVDGIDFCKDRYTGITYLVNSSDAVWTVVDPSHTITAASYAPMGLDADIFHEAMDPVYPASHLLAPGNVIQLPSDYWGIRVRFHQNLTSTWVAQRELETGISTVVQNWAIDRFVRGSAARRAVVDCALAARTAIAGTKAVRTADDLAALVRAALSGTLSATAAGTTCVASVRNLRGLPESERLNAFRSTIYEAKALYGKADTLADRVPGVIDWALTRMHVRL